MINNFVQSYSPSHKIYTDDTTRNHIHLGDIQAALDIQFIKKQNISTVTAAAGMDHIQYQNSIQHFVYPLLDINSQDISKFFSQFHQIVERQLQKGSILVHCAAGISRSATLVIAYLMKKLNWTFKQAILFVRRSRPTVCPNLGFQRQLKQYEQALHKQMEVPALMRRGVARTSQQAKHASVDKNDKNRILPEIDMLARTQLKPKVLELFGPEDKYIPRNRSESRKDNNTRKVIKPVKSNSMAQRQGPSRQILSKQIYRGIGKPSLWQASDKLIVRRLHGLYSNQPERENIIEESVSSYRQRQLRGRPLHKIAYF